MARNYSNKEIYSLAITEKILLILDPILSIKAPDKTFIKCHDRLQKFIESEYIEIETKN